MKKNYKKISHAHLMYLLFYLTFFSYIILGNQTHIRYADRENMEDDVAQPVLRNHPDRMESTEGLKLIITSSRIIKCPQLGLNQSPISLKTRALPPELKGNTVATDNRSSRGLHL